MGFWPAKVLLSAVEIGLFTTLGDRALTGAELQQALGLHARANPDFFDSLVALRFLERDGDGPAGRYRNTPETAAFLDRSSPRFMGGFLEMSNARLYQFWGDLTDGAPHRQAAERAQTQRHVDVRRAVQQAGTARAVHGRDGRDLGRQLPGVCRQV